MTSGGAAFARRVQVPRPGERAGFIWLNGGNELTLAGVVKEDLACPGSSLPEKSFKRQATSDKQQARPV